jgi:hypothetical protein
VLAVAGPPPLEVVPVLGVSAAVHLAYVLALTHGYEVADFSLAYPIARGGGAGSALAFTLLLAAVR